MKKYNKTNKPPKKSNFLDNKEIKLKKYVFLYKLPYPINKWFVICY